VNTQTLRRPGARLRAAGRAALLVAGLAGVPLAGGSALAVAAEARADVGPQELMNDISKRMFEALDADRAAIRKDPDKVYPLVDRILLPHFDTEYAAQLILSQNWRKASAEQQKRFISALYKALLHTYGGALGEFTADRLKMLPFRGDPAATTAMVRTEVRRSSGALVPVDYRLRKTEGGWKAYDVIIEGISYVKNYREDLGAEVGQKGLEAVISRLEREGLDTSAATGEKPGR
jgi:phospholipid transport system substrate-binding protein